VQREGAAVAEIDVVEVQLEDLVLGRLDLQDDRHELLEHLAAVRPLPRLRFNRKLVGQEEVARQLLRDGAAADQVRPVAKQIREDRADDADGIDTGVVIKAAVFNCQYRFLHARRNGFQRHAPALFT
jgi:hypothetical protein